MFSNKSKLKLKPIKDSSIGMLSRAPQPAGNELLPACATTQGDKTSFSASGAGRCDGAHCTHLNSGWGDWGCCPMGKRIQCWSNSVPPGLTLLLLVPSVLVASDDERA